MKRRNTPCFEYNVLPEGQYSNGEWFLSMYGSHTYTDPPAITYTKPPMGRQLFDFEDLDTRVQTYMTVGERDTIKHNPLRIPVDEKIAVVRGRAALPRV